MGRLGKYELLRELGRGAFGTVYLARETLLEVQRALKVLHPHLMYDETLRARFHREAQVAARLEHPHIVPVYEFGEVEGRFYLAMRYMEGGSLKARLKREGRLPWPEVMRITRELAEGLAYAHAQGVVHRDLKPSNILFDQAGRAAIGDFGFAKVLRGVGVRQSLTGSGESGMIGTPAYMAPEQWRGQAVGPAADQYALACLVVEMLTGEVLFGGETPAEVMTRHLLEPPRLPEAFPRRLRAVLERALAKEPDARYPDVRAFAEALAAVSQTKASSRLLRRRSKTRVAPAPRAGAAAVRPSSEAKARPEPPRRHGAQPRPRWVWGALAVVLLLMLAGVWWAGRGERATPGATVSPGPSATTGATTTAAVAGFASPTRARTLTPTFTPSPTPTPFVGPVMMGTPIPRNLLAPVTMLNADKIQPIALWGKGEVGDVVWSPDGGRLAVASSIGVYLYDARTLDEVRFWESETRVGSVAFSPDGALLATGGYDGVVRLWRTSDGALIRTLEGHEGTVTSVAFSPDGTLLASGAGDKTVRLWRVADGTLVRTLEGHEAGVRSVAFSPDGTLMASGSGGRTVRLWRVEDGVLLHTLRHYGVTSVAFSPDGALLASGSSWYETVRLWRVSDGSLVRTLEDHEGTVTSVAFSPDGILLASGADDKTVRLWRVADGTLVRTLEGHEAGVRSVAFSPDGILLASTSGDSTVRLWQVLDGTLVRILEGYTADSVSHVIWSSGGQRLIGILSSNIHLYDVDKAKEMRAFNISDGISNAAFSPDSIFVAQARCVDKSGYECPRAQVQIFVAKKDFQNLDEMYSRTWSGRVDELVFSHDGQWLAAAGCKVGIVTYRSRCKTWERIECVRSEIRLWHLANGNLQWANVHGTDPIVVAFSPDDHLLATGGGAPDYTVRIWQVSDGLLKKSLLIGAAVQQLVFSPDSTMLAVVTEGKIHLWRVADGALLRTLEGYEGSVHSITFSPDGTLLASGSCGQYDSEKTRRCVKGEIRLWRVSDGSLVRTLEGHTDDVNSVAFSPDGTLLASASADGTIRLWGVVASSGGATR